MNRSTNENPGGAAAPATATITTGDVGANHRGRSVRERARIVAIALMLALALPGIAIGQIETDEDVLFGSPIETDEDSLFGAPAGGDDGGSAGASGSTSEDDLFGGSPLVTDVQETTEDIAAILLATEETQIGGRFSTSIASDFGWDDIDSVTSDFTDPDTLGLSTALATQVFLDARPDEDFRVFAKATVSAPFDTVPAPEDPEDPAERSFEDIVQLDEMFADFDWNDAVFFRAGKQTLNWGVGYFFSPADLLSIAEIDPEDPEAELEGPIAIKTSVPFGTSSGYLYVLPEFAEEPFDTGLAIQGETVVSGTEITGGLVYQRDIAPAGMVTVSTSISDVSVYAEGVLSYGSNRTFVQEAALPLGVEAATRDDEIFVNATLGATYFYTPDEWDSSISIFGQYLFNGEGYDDPSIITDNIAGVGALIAAGDIAASDLISTGMHYSALSVSWLDILGSDFTGSVLWLQNYSDMSARVSPSISTTLLDSIDLTASVPLTFGDEGDEFSPNGDSLSISVTASFGGRF